MSKRMAIAAVVAFGLFLTLWVAFSAPATARDNPGGGEAAVELNAVKVVSMPVHRPQQGGSAPSLAVEPPLVMSVNYAHDWVEGGYTVGHTIWITTTEPVTTNVKATAEMETQEIPWWGGGTGFSTNLDDPWVPEQPDMEPYDWVFGALDNGEAGSVRIGEIHGQIDLDADTITGTIHADWFTESLNGNCGVWEEGGPSASFTVDPDGGSYTCTFGTMGWDLLPGHDVGVGYQEPDGDWVFNVFREPTPDVGVDKWAEGSGQCAAGGFCVFTIQCRNDGDAVAETIWLTDTLPSDLTYWSDSSPVPTHVFPEWVFWELGPLAPGEEMRFQLVLQNSATAGTWLTNQVDVFTQFDENPDNDHAEAQVEVIEGQPDVYVDKDADPGDPAAGETYLYHINYSNNEPVASGYVLLTETLPLSTTLESWSSWNEYGLWNEVSYSGNELVLEVPSIPGHWGDTILLRLRVDGDASEGTQLHNEVEIATAGDTNPDNNWHEHDTWVAAPRWDGGVDKYFSWGELVAGGRVQYDMELRNNGNMPTHLWLTDTLPAGTVYDDSWLQLSGPNWVQRPPDDVFNGKLAWDMGPMEPGESYYLSLWLLIQEGAEAGTVLTNCVEVGIDGPDDNPGNDLSCVVSRVSDTGASLHVEKSVWWQGEEQLGYWIGLWNVGTEDLLDVWVTDTYPISTTWSGDWWWNRWSGYDIQVDHDEPNQRLVFTTERIERNEHVAINFQVNLDGEIIGAPGLAFTNTVEAPYPGDVYPGDNYAEAVAYSREPAPDVWVQKWAEGSGQCAAGGLCVFTIRYGNEGELTAGVIELTDTLPDGTTYVADSSGAAANVGAGWVSWEVGPLDPGEERRFEVVVENSAGPGEWLLNQLDAFTEGESDEGDNHAEAEVEVIEGQPDLNVNKQAAPGDPAAGQTYLYQIDYGNGQPVASGHVVLTETLPLSTTLESWSSWNGYGLWSEVSYSGNQLVLEAAAIPGHWGDTIMLRLRVDGDAPEGTQLHNEVEIATAGDADPGNNWQEHDTWVSAPRWDGRVHKWLNWAELVPGGEVEYEMSFANEGNMQFDHLWLTDTLPAGTVYRDSWLQESGGNWVQRPPDDVFDGKLAWDMGPLEPAEWHHLSLLLGIEEGVELGSVLTNCVEIGIAGPDENPENDSECVENVVSEPGPNLRLGKRVWWEGDGQLRYSIGLWNVGTEDLLGVWVTDTYPISTIWNGDWWWDRWSGYGIDVDHDELNRRLIFTTERIERNERMTIDFRVDLDGEIVGAPGLAFTNTVESPYPGDVYPDDNYAEVVAYSREPAPDVYVDKWPEGSGQCAAAGPCVFNIRYGNQGELTAGVIELTDTLPDGMTYVADSSGAVANVGTGWVSWEVGPLDPGEERRFEVVLENSAGPGEWLRNQVDVFTPDDWNPDNNHAEAEVEVIEGQPDLYVNKQAEPGDPAAGQTYLYHIDYGNVQPVASGHVVLTETLPLSTTLESWSSWNGYGLWSEVSYSGNQLVLEAPAIPGHWGDTIMLRLRVDGDAPEGTQLHNEVEIATAGDIDPDSNWHEHDTWVGGPRWDGRVHKSLHLGELVPGGYVEYEMSFANEGNMQFDHLWLTDTLPAGTVYGDSWLQLSDGSWVQRPPDDEFNGKLAWDMGPLEPGESHYLSLSLGIEEGVELGSVLTNCVEIGIAGPDENPENDSECVESRVSEPGPNLHLGKRVWWEGDGQLRYAIDVLNVGTEDLLDVWVTDTYPILTTWNGDWWWNRGSGYGIDVDHDEPNRRLIFATERIESNEHVWINFRVDLDGEIVGVPGLAFGNMVEAPYPGDVYPDDNYDEVWAHSGPECPEPSAPGRPSPEDGAADVGLHADLDWSEFDGRWWWVNEDPSDWSLSENPGYLRMMTHPGAVGDENLLLQDSPAGDFTVTTRLLFEPTSDFQIAGLVLWQDSDNFLMLGRAYCDTPPPGCVGNGIYFDKWQGGSLVDGNYAMSTAVQGEAYLRVAKEGDTYSGYYSENGLSWTLLGSHTPTDTVTLSAVGVAAGADLADLRIPADFDYFWLQDDTDSYIDHFSGATSYDVYFGTTSPLPYIGSTTSSEYTLTRLDEWTQYYWEVVAVNDCGTASGGEWSFATGANHRPTLGTVDPSIGSGPTGATTYFTTTWMDADGWEDLKQCYFHIGDSPSIVGNVTLLYNAVKDKLWIRSDDGTMWLGGYAPGSANTMGNSQAIVQCSLSSAEGSGDTLAVKWAIEFKVGYEGSKKTGLKCKDRAKARAKAKWKGTWVVY